MSRLDATSGEGASGESAVGRVVVAGIGSALRRDDGVGQAVVRRFLEATGAADGCASRCRILAPLGDPLDLVGEWDGAVLAVVVGATRSGRAPGTITELEIVPGATGPPAQSSSQSSTHGIGIAQVLRLARALGSGPSRTIVVGIEGEDFAPGSKLSPSVEAVLGEAAARVDELVAAASHDAGSPTRAVVASRPRAPRR